MITTIEKFKSLPADKQRRVLHLAINVNGRIGGGAKFDNNRYGRPFRSTYPVSVLRVLVDKLNRR